MALESHDLRGEVGNYTGAIVIITDARYHMPKVEDNTTGCGKSQIAWLDVSMDSWDFVNIYEAASPICSNPSYVSVRNAAGSRVI